MTLTNQISEEGKCDTSSVLKILNRSELETFNKNNWYEYCFQQKVQIFDTLYGFFSSVSTHSLFLTTVYLFKRRLRSVEFNLVDREISITYKEEQKFNTRMCALI